MLFRDAVSRRAATASSNTMCSPKSAKLGVLNVHRTCDAEQDASISSSDNILSIFEEEGIAQEKVEVSG